MMLQNNMGEEEDGGVDKIRLGTSGKLLIWGLIIHYSTF